MSRAVKLTEKNLPSGGIFLSKLSIFMIDVVAAIIFVDGKVLLAKRPEDKHQGGKWEFPGGKVDDNESNKSALVRECFEELNINIESPMFFDDVTFNYGDKQVHISFYKTTQFSGHPQGMEGQQVQWFSLSELKDLEFPAANQKIVHRLVEHDL